MACVPRCFKCMLEIPSGPVAGDRLVALMASIVLSGVNGVGRSGSVGSEWSRCRMCLSVRVCGRWLMFA